MQNHGSITNVIARAVSLEKTLNAISHLEARCDGRVWQKTCKQNSFLVQTEKKC